MKISTYKTLISNLPVGQQSFSTKRDTWQKAQNEIFWLEDFNDQLFDNNETLQVNRKDIFNSSSSMRKLILKTIYWGYPRGMRGNHFVDILKNIEVLETILNEIKQQRDLKTSDFDNLIKKLKCITGLGLSTYSKLLYFLDLSINNNPCLILDQRLIDVFNSEFYDDFSDLAKINAYNKEDKYLSYLDITNKLADELQTKGENIEQFLFMFGNNLKL